MLYSLRRYDQAAGVSFASAGFVGRAVAKLLSAVGGVVRTLAEHHGRHTDRDDDRTTAAAVAASSSSACCGDSRADGNSVAEEEPEPEAVEEKKAGC